MKLKVIQEIKNDIKTAYKFGGYFYVCSNNALFYRLLSYK